ncbi:hypothetical protein ACJ41O_004048 [Fusarium nematophilum]
MAPDHDVYRKVGRGGAGNYYASKPDDASKVSCPPPHRLPFSCTGFPYDLIVENSHTRKDLEAQELATTPAPPPDRSTAHVPARAGRGGAGNYVDPANLPDAREQEEMADKTAAAVNASLKKNHHTRGGLAGRGGAGNWQADEGEEHEAAKRDEDDKAKGQHLEKKVKEAVEKGLKMPEKVHHGQDKKKHEDA